MERIEYINTMIYAARIKDKDILYKSSSGGVFTVLSDYFLELGNAVVAVVYDYDNHVSKFRLMTTKEERNKALGSKYMQSKPDNIYNEAFEWLLKNPQKKLLFVGMGCQADGFRKYVELKGVRERVYIVDIICHGSPSPKLWSEYARMLEKRHLGKISFLTFKDKRNGWMNPTAYVSINNKEIFIKEYVKLFFSGCALRPICHECPYAKIERKTDITIGDFWHIEKTIPNFYSEKGNSLFLIHSDRGKELFENVEKNIEYKISNEKQCWQKNLEYPTPVSKFRERFWKIYQRKGISAIEKYYIRQERLALLKLYIKNFFKI